MVNDRAKIATEVRRKSGVAPQGQRQGTQTILILLHPSGTIEVLVALRSTGLHRNSTNPVVVPAAALTTACNGAPLRVSGFVVSVMVSFRSTDLSPHKLPHESTPALPVESSRLQHAVFWILESTACGATLGSSAEPRYRRAA